MRENTSLQIPRGKKIAIAISIASKGYLCNKTTCPFISTNKGINIYKDVEQIIDDVSKSNDVTCTINLCSNITIRGANNIILCNGAGVVTKHRYDELLKCLTFSDILLVVIQEPYVPRIFANIMCLAQMENVEVKILRI